MSNDRQMYKEDVHTYNGVLLSHKKEQIWVSCSEVDEPRACYTDWSKSEKEKQVHQHMYMESRTMVLMNLVEKELVDSAGEGEGGMNWERWFWWTYLQEWNGDASIENGLVHTVWEGESGTNGESSINIYTLSCVKQMDSGKLLCNTGSPAWLSVMT